MLLNEEQSKLRALVTEAIAVLCRNGLSYQNEVSVEGLLGITTDNQDVFLISLNEIIRHEAQIDEHETYTSINTAQRISNTHRPGPLSSKNRKRSHSTATVGSQPPIESDSLPFDITPVSSVNAAEPPSKRSSSPAAIDSNNEKTNTTNAEHTVTEPKPAGEELKKDSKPQVEILTENVKTESVEAQVESHGDTNNEETTHMGPLKRSKKRKSGTPFRVDPEYPKVEDDVIFEYTQKFDFTRTFPEQPNVSTDVSSNKDLTLRSNRVRDRNQLLPWRPCNLLGRKSSSGSCTWNLEDAEDNPTTSAPLNVPDISCCPSNSQLGTKGFSPAPTGDNLLQQSNRYASSYLLYRPKHSPKQIDSSQFTEGQQSAKVTNHEVHKKRIDSAPTLPIVKAAVSSAKAVRKSFVCEVCGKVYGTWAGRYYHNQMKHGAEKKFQCNYCEKGFAKGSDLNRHMQSRHKETYFK